VSNKDVLIECVKLFFLCMSKLNVSMWQDKGGQNDFSFGGQGEGGYHYCYFLSGDQKL
jgi:hypothetical protein